MIFGAKSAAELTLRSADYPKKTKNRRRKMKKDYFIGKNGRKTAFYVNEAGNTRAVFQMVHGMAEHIVRYEDFAKYLADSGITFVGADVRCHGENFDEKLGYAEGDTWNDSIADQRLLSDEIGKLFGGVKRIVCGHSYGSFLTQGLIERGIKADMFILMGSCFMKGADVNVGSFVADRYAARDPKCVPEVILNLTFGSYDKKFEGGSWLSRDENEVAKYDADPLCGFSCSANFYSNFFRGLKALHAKNSLDALDKNVPIRIFSGNADPVGKFGKGVRKLYDYYKAQGVRDVSMKLYEGARHELVNEINKAEVYADIAAAVGEILV